MTTPPTGKAPGPVRGTSAPEPDADERSAQLGRWSKAGVLLVVASALGTLVIARFPETIALGVLALGGVAAAIIARRFRAPASATTAAGPPGRTPAGPGAGPRGAAEGPAARAGGPTGATAGRPAREAGSGSSGGGRGARPELTTDQRRERSTIVTIVMGSIIAFLHLFPALTWSVSTSHQECLDGAVTNQAMDACENGLDDRLLGWLGSS